MRPSTSFVRRPSAGNWLLLLLLLAAPAIVQAQFSYTTNNDGTLNLAQYSGSAGSVVIPNTTNGLPVTSIGSVAFFENRSLTNLTIGTNVATIGGQAFSYSSLAAVTIPPSVTNIAFGAFFNCNDLLAFTVNSNNPVYASAAGVLFNQSQTNLIEFPAGKAGSYAVPTNVTSIGVDAFFDCTNLTSIVIPASVASIGDYAFDSCSSLTVITVNANNSAYASVAGVLFNQSQTTLIQYPAGSAATSYAMPNSVTNIGNDAFYGSASLAHVTLGTNVTTVSAAAFENCHALVSVTFPGSVALVEEDAFAECASLTNVIIGAGVTNIQPQAFLGCTSLMAITVASNNPAFSSVAGVLFNQNQTTLFQYPAGSSGTSYAIPNSVTRIGEDAFLGSYNLTRIAIDTNVLSIADEAFLECFNLASITLPNSVTNLGFSIFFECYSLTNVTIGTGVTSLGFQVFSYCDGLTAIQFLGNAPAVGSDVFDNDNAATIYYLPGTTGWTTPFDGLPAAPWLPQVQTGPGSFGVYPNGFGFTISWAAGQTVIVQASTNLVQPGWSPVGTNILAGFSSPFRDPEWTNHPRRFYRLSSP
ncbi:MAG: leucine-rich repeat domain-containing protein [Verrucomicrobiota bacterium]|jgi:hypothetical protein